MEERRNRQEVKRVGKGLGKERENKQRKKRGQVGKGEKKIKQSHECRFWSLGNLSRSAACGRQAAEMLAPRVKDGGDHYSSLQQMA